MFRWSAVEWLVWWEQCRNVAAVWTDAQGPYAIRVYGLIVLEYDEINVIFKAEM